MSIPGWQRAPSSVRSSRYTQKTLVSLQPGLLGTRALQTDEKLDLAELFGSLSTYLAGKHADFLRGRFIVANWDMQDLESHEEEIVTQGLLKNQPFKGEIGPGGHWKTSTDSTQEKVVILDNQRNCR